MGKEVVVSYITTNAKSYRNSCITIGTKIQRAQQNQLNTAAEGHPSGSQRIFRFDPLRRKEPKIYNFSKTSLLLPLFLVQCPKWLLNTGFRCISFAIADSNKIQNNDYKPSPTTIIEKIDDASLDCFPPIAMTVSQHLAQSQPFR